MVVTLACFTGSIINSCSYNHNKAMALLFGALVSHLFCIFIELRLLHHRMSKVNSR